jgi:hypothetical protein
MALCRRDCSEGTSRAGESRRDGPSRPTGFLNEGRAAWLYAAVVIRRGRRGEEKVGAMGHRRPTGFLNKW